MTNITRMNIFFFLFKFSLYTPFFGIILMNSYGVSVSNIAILFAVYSFSTVFFELPSSIVGDLMGKKKMLIFGVILLTLGTAFLLNKSFMFLLHAEILIGFSQASISGIDQSIIFENSKDANFGKIVSRYYSWGWLSLALSFLISNLIVKFVGMEYLIFLTVITTGLSIIPLLSLHIHTNKSTHNNIKKHFFDGIHSGLNELISNKKNHIHFVFDILLTIGFVIIYHLIQPIMVLNDISTDYNGYLYFVGTLFAFLSSLVAEKTINHCKKWFFMVFILSTGVCSAILFTNSMVIFFVIFILYRFFWTYAMNLSATLENENMKEDEEMRSSILSSVSLIKNLVIAIFLLIVSKLTVSINLVLNCMLAIGLLIFIGWYVLASRHRNKT